MDKISNHLDVELFRLSMVLLAVACIITLVLGNLIFGRRQRKLEQELSEKYPSIYRVTALPSDGKCVLKAEGASVEIGDYGWEAEPVFHDDLIYLHGLNGQWQVVWYAGFRPEQVELVGPKPRSQYYIFPYWRKNNIPKCPFPVGKYSADKLYPKTHLGFPVKIQGDWVQGSRVSSG